MVISSPLSIRCGPRLGWKNVDAQQVGPDDAANEHEESDRQQVAEQEVRQVRDRAPEIDQERIGTIPRSATGGSAASRSGEVAICGKGKLTVKPGARKSFERGGWKRDLARERRGVYVPRILTPGNTRRSLSRPCTSLE